jgi:hypothetical protein
VLAGNRLWVGNSLGQIQAASLVDGTATLFDKVGSPISLAPVVAGGTLYVLDDGGRITAYR